MDLPRRAVLVRIACALGAVAATTMRTTTEGVTSAPSTNNTNNNTKKRNGDGSKHGRGRGRGYDDDDDEEETSVKEKWARLVGTCQRMLAMAEDDDRSLVEDEAGPFAEVEPLLPGNLLEDSESMWCLSALSALRDVEIYARTGEPLASLLTHYAAHVASAATVSTHGSWLTPANVARVKTAVGIGLAHPGRAATALVDLQSLLYLADGDSVGNGNGTGNGDGQVKKHATTAALQGAWAHFLAEPTAHTQALEQLDHLATHGTSDLDLDLEHASVPDRRRPQWARIAMLWPARRGAGVAGMPAYAVATGVTWRGVVAAARGHLGRLSVLVPGLIYAGPDTISRRQLRAAQLVAAARVTRSLLVPRGSLTRRATSVEVAAVTSLLAVTITAHLRPGDPEDAPLWSVAQSFVALAPEMTTKMTNMQSRTNADPGPGHSLAWLRAGVVDGSLVAAALQTGQARRHAGFTMAADSTLPAALVAVLDLLDAYYSEGHDDDDEVPVSNRRAAISWARLGRAWALVGLLRLRLLAPPLGLDPASLQTLERRAVEVRVTQGLLPEALACRAQESCPGGHPAATHRRWCLEGLAAEARAHASELAAAAVQRPVPAQYPDLSRDVSRFLTGPADVPRALDLAARGADDAAYAARAAQWSAGAEALCEALWTRYPHYADLLLPFQQSVREASRGYALLSAAHTLGDDAHGRIESTVRAAAGLMAFPARLVTSVHEIERKDAVSALGAAEEVDAVAGQVGRTGPGSGWTTPAGAEAGGYTTRVATLVAAAGASAREACAVGVRQTPAWRAAAERFERTLWALIRAWEELKEREERRQEEEGEVFKLGIKAQVTVIKTDEEMDEEDFLASQKDYGAAFRDIEELASDEMPSADMDRATIATLANATNAHAKLDLMTSTQVRLVAGEATDVESATAISASLLAGDVLDRIVYLHRLVFNTATATATATGSGIHE